MAALCLLLLALPLLRASPALSTPDSGMDVVLRRLHALEDKVETLEASNIKLQATNVEQGAMIRRLETSRKELESKLGRLESELRRDSDVITKHERNDIEIDVTKFENGEGEKAPARARRSAAAKTDAGGAQRKAGGGGKILAPLPNPGGAPIGGGGGFLTVVFHVGQLTERVSVLTEKVEALEASSTASPEQVAGLSAAVSSLRASTARDVARLDARVSALSPGGDRGSSVYVQWGSANCSAASTELVYSGAVGGGHFNNQGAGANYLCLTLNPVQSDRALPRYYTWLYGAEYEHADSAHSKDPACAVCRSALPTTVMVPGTNKCETGWTLQYAGFLMAGYWDHKKATEYVCVDSRFESLPGTNENKDGALIYFTAASCGSLPCDPYVNKKIITCAVCSK